MQTCKSAYERPEMEMWGTGWRALVWYCIKSLEIVLIGHARQEKGTVIDDVKRKP